MIVPNETDQHNTERKKIMKKDELKLLKMSDIQVREVDWLWYPYIPFGKLTIIHGDPGEGKTTFALRLAAACSNGTPLPNMDTIAPITVIYQSAEDGLDDTIKPRLIEAGADQERIINICEEEKSLHMLDERIEKAIVQCGAKMLILDPMQGYLGERVDMNRANEVRTIMKSIGQVAQRTGCAVVLVGHLNKAAGMSSVPTVDSDLLTSAPLQEAFSWWADCGATKMSVSSFTTNLLLLPKVSPSPSISVTKKAFIGSTVMKIFLPKNCCPAMATRKKQKRCRQRN